MRIMGGKSIEIKCIAPRKEQSKEMIPKASNPEKETGIKMRMGRRSKGAEAMMG